MVGNNGRPKAICSLFHGLLGEVPAPIPKCNRSPEICCTDDTIFASNPGSRFITLVTNVPSLIFEVTAAHAVRLVKHSSMDSVRKLDPEK